MLLDERGHCILRNVIRNPRDQWRDCAMQQRGAEWAECYRRENREVDDKLDGVCLPSLLFHISSSELLTH